MLKYAIKQSQEKRYFANNSNTSISSFNEVNAT